MSETRLPSLGKFPLFVGWTLVSVGVVANEWVLTAAFSSDGVLEPETRMLIGSVDILVILAGILLIQMRKFVNSKETILHLSQSCPRTLAVSIGIALAIGLLFSLEGIFYAINQYKNKEVGYEIGWVPRSAREDASVGQKPAHAFKGEAIEDRLLGYKPPPNAQIFETKKMDGNIVYSATYSTDEYSRRITPAENRELRNRFILFFGCSMTFGEGVGDKETMPFYVAQYASKYQPYNYGMVGYGPQPMLAKLQSDELAGEINEKRGVAIYTFIDDHFYRAVGAMRVVNGWGSQMPFYTIDAQDRLVREGNFTTGRPVLALLYWGMGKSQIVKYFNIDFSHKFHSDYIKITERIIAESYKAFKQQFPESEFYVLLYPGVNRGREMIPNFERSKIKYLDYSQLVDWPHKELTIEHDPHPTAKGHRFISTQLARSIGIYDTDHEEWQAYRTSAR